MRRLGDTVARLASTGRVRPDATPNPRLRPLDWAGANPGELDAFVHTPPQPVGGALIVVLHGCSQTAEAYDRGAGWSRHAEATGFSVLYPQQRRANNPGLCFNWFSSEDTTRGRGEAASIAAMILAVVRDLDLDPRRVFITGLSAGGAMSAVMLAAYPELFAAGAVIAGLPYGAASTMPQAFEAMRGLGPAPGPDPVRRAAPGAERWPRLAVIHGAADHTVDVANADRLLAQWLGVHGLGSHADRETVMGPCRHRTWVDGRGEIRVEDYRIAGMGHGTPLDVRADPYASAGPFMLDAGFASTARLIEAWDLGGGGDIGRGAPAAQDGVHKGTDPLKIAVIDPVGALGGVQAVIENALRRAGLMP